MANNITSTSGGSGISGGSSTQSNLNSLDTTNNAKDTSFEVRPDRVKNADIPKLKPEKGRIIYDIDENLNKFWNGTQWVNISANTTNNLGYQYIVTFYSDLLLISNPQEGDLARVLKSSGVPFINRKISGAYVYLSGVWEYASQDLQDEILSNDADILALQIGKFDNPTGTNSQYLAGDGSIEDLSNVASTDLDNELIIGTDGKLYVQTGSAADGLPVGGEKNQLLFKDSSTDYDVSYQYGWFDYLTGVKYTGQEATNSTGTIREVVFRGDTVFRLTSDAFTGLYPTIDAFYENFDGVDVSDKIVEKGD